ncbi:MAG: excinuclease ABC subunit UvrC [Candidatus Thorarchaeota archaeon]
MTDLQKLVKDLPDEPGVYLWKDENGTILYIGKSKYLRRRVGSYLRRKSLLRRTWEMMQQARDLEVIVTNTDKEALLLEATLIRKHQPKYNLALKDDKRHAWIRVDPRDEIPTFIITREIEKDGAKYYGPYGSTKRLEKFLDTVRKQIPVAMCTEPHKAKRECMDYHLGRCSAPCFDRIPMDEYRSLVDQMSMYLEGRLEELTDIVRGQMEQASIDMEFEKAAALRDRIYDIEIVMRSQKVVEVNGINRDILGIARTEQAALVELLTVRNGRLIGHDNFFWEVDLEVKDAEIIEAFVEQFYFQLPQLPDEILLPIEIEDMAQLAEWLSESTTRPVELLVPKEGKRYELVGMANTNADRALRKMLILEDSSQVILDVGVKQLREALNLKQAPLHIEGFDIANIQGTDPTGSCVVFRNGMPDNSSYRMFKIRIKETPDDYAMMNEVVYRRYRGVLERGDPLPDLILIDGGKGQLNVTVDALTKLGLEYLNVTALAKREELLYTRENLNGIALEWASPGLHLVQRIRDEAHRFAQRYHHKLREKRVSGSILEEAPGIGPKRRASLLKAFGSYDKIREASVEFLMTVEGMSEKAAKDLRKWMDSEDPL